MESKGRLAGIGQYLLQKGRQGGSAAMSLTRESPGVAALGGLGIAGAGYMAYRSMSPDIQPVSQTQATAASTEPSAVKPQPVNDYKPQGQSYQRPGGVNVNPNDFQLEAQDLLKERLRLQKEKDKLGKDYALADRYAQTLGAGGY